MTLQRALDECSICDLFAKNVSDEHKFQVIDKIMSTPSTKVPKVKLCNIISWLLKKVEWQKQQLEKEEEEELEKANEWHYVKDGDFPKNKIEKKYLVALKSEYSGFFYETDIWCESLHCFASNNPTKVYAWKEIVPPKKFEDRIKD